MEAARPTVQNRSMGEEVVSLLLTVMMRIFGECRAIAETVPQGISWMLGKAINRIRPSRLGDYTYLHNHSATSTVWQRPRFSTSPGWTRSSWLREIQRAKSYATKKELWQSLPRKLQYQTFNRILDYLESSNKILLDEGEIVWTFPSNPRLRRLLRKTVSSCASALAIPESLLVILASQEHLHPKLISSRNDVKRTFFASSSLNGYKYGFNHA